MAGNPLRCEEEKRVFRQRYRPLLSAFVCVHTAAKLNFFFLLFWIIQVDMLVICLGTKKKLFPFFPSTDNAVLYSAINGQKSY